jgi:hypothetical protein
MAKATTRRRIKVEVQRWRQHGPPWSIPHQLPRSLMMVVIINDDTINASHAIDDINHTPSSGVTTRNDITGRTAAPWPWCLNDCAHHGRSPWSIRHGG